MPTAQRYFSAAIAASLIFGLLELNAPWMAGPELAELRHPAGLLAKLLASMFTPAPSLLRAGSDHQQLAYGLFMGLQGLLISVFIGLLCWRIHPGLARSRRLDTALIATQLCAVVALDSLAFHLILATELAALLPLRRALAWVAALFMLGVGVDVAMLATVRSQMNDRFLLAMLGMLTLERCMLILGVAFAWLARQEQRGRVQLGAANAQLRATQSLLADTVRAAERMRIARDLHDAIGHHLTALSLHLDLATRQAGAMPPAALHTARGLARSLLAEVRGVVSAERADSAVDLHQALALLCAGIPVPAIELRVDRLANDCSAAAAHTLLYCVQEAITNTVRHANATRLLIEIQRDERGLAAHIADNGRGSRAAAGEPVEGNGLAGMRERLASHGGTLRVGAASDGTGASGLHGYRLKLLLPYAGSGPEAAAAAEAGTWVAAAGGGL